MSKRKKIIAGNQISKVVTLDLAGYPQKVIIEGKCESLPVVIVLHGGPGMPPPFCLGARGMFPELTKRFLMVYWDQLGCGGNRNPKAKGLSISNYVDMTVDLIQKIKQQFPKNRLYLFSISWGAVLSAFVVRRHPGLVDGVLAWGQFIREPWLNPDAMDALKASKISKKKMQRISRLNAENFDVAGLKLIYRSLSKYTDGYIHRAYPSMPMRKLLAGYLRSPDYSLGDLASFMSNEAMLNIAIYRELLTLDFSDVLSQVTVPYKIYYGESDMVCTSKAAIAQMKKCPNPNLSITIVERSGHMPSREVFLGIGDLLGALEQEDKQEDKQDE